MDSCGLIRTNKVNPCHCRYVTMLRLLPAFSFSLSQELSHVSQERMFSGTVPHWRVFRGSEPSQIRYFAIFR